MKTNSIERARAVTLTRIVQKEKLEAEIADIKATIEADLPEEGFKNDQVTISRRKASKSVSVDLAALKKAEPDCYEGLLADYPKVKETAASVSYSFKKNE